MNDLTSLSIDDVLRVLDELFERACSCRPVNTARLTHSHHNCETTLTDAIRTVLHTFVIVDNEPTRATRDQLGANFKIVDAAVRRMGAS